MVGKGEQGIYLSSVNKSISCVAGKSLYPELLAQLSTQQRNSGVYMHVHFETHTHTQTFPTPTVYTGMGSSTGKITVNDPEQYTVPHIQASAKL